MQPSREGLLKHVARAAELLRAGELVVYPTETFYALGALASSPSALARLIAAKGRPEGKSLPLIAADLAQVESVGFFEAPLARRIASRLWPGPLTLVIPARSGIAPELVAPDRTVAVRIPGSRVARSLALSAGGPLVSTSANPSGEAPPSSAEAVSPKILAAVAEILDGGQTPGGKPSTLVLIEDASFRVVREGAVSRSQIEEACR